MEEEGEGERKGKQREELRGRILFRDFLTFYLILKRPPLGVGILLVQRH